MSYNGKRKPKRVKETKHTIRHINKLNDSSSKRQTKKDLRVYAKQPEKLYFESASHIVLFGHKTLQPK